MEGHSYSSSNYVTHKIHFIYLIFYYFSHSSSEMEELHPAVVSEGRRRLVRTFIIKATACLCKSVWVSFLYCFIDNFELVGHSICNMTFSKLSTSTSSIYFHLANLRFLRSQPVLKTSGEIFKHPDVAFISVEEVDYYFNTIISLNHH